jgi:hemolysin activation/secretion protein
MKKILIIVNLFFVFLGGNMENVCLAQSSASQIQRAQEILEKERALSQKLEEPQKIYIKKIMVEGASLLSPEEIREIISSFQKRWLTKEDIQQIMESFRQAYQRRGYAKQPAKISYRIEKRNLIIVIEELTP